MLSSYCRIAFSDGQSSDVRICGTEVLGHLCTRIWVLRSHEPRFLNFSRLYPHELVTAAKL